MYRTDLEEETMAFKAGDAVFHPVRGAGVVTGIKDRKWDGKERRYYMIKLLGHPGTKVMVPTSTAKEIGLRHAMSQAKLKKVWRVLRDDPQKLPKDHKDRYAVIEGKLHTGDAFEVAEAVRDMAWRRKQEGKLTTRGKRIYEEAVMLLAGEIAAVQEIEVGEAEGQVHAKLQERLAPASVA
jgi:RNA polymerase-interacting CarD/CdnL/TRCF family regulator